MNPSDADVPAVTVSPSVANLPAWIVERFPPAHWLMVFVLTGAALVIGRGLSSTSGAYTFSGEDLLAFVAVWCFFLMLRVFDEHKDFDLDMINFPGRVLQRGRISLTQLKWVCAASIGIQLGVSVVLDGGRVGAVSFWWLLVIGWSVLMANEFFVGSWLGQRLLLYAASHMVVLPMALLWMAQMGAGQRPLPLEVGLLAGLSFCTGAAFEVTRKLKGADEERASVASYSQILGPTFGAALVLGFLVVAACLSAGLLQHVLSGEDLLAWYVGIAALLLGPATTLHLYKNAPTTKARKANEGAVGFMLVGGYALLIAAFLTEAASISWG